MEWNGTGLDGGSHAHDAVWLVLANRLHYLLAFYGHSLAMGSHRGGSSRSTVAVVVVVLGKSLIQCFRARTRAS